MCRATSEGGRRCSGGTSHHRTASASAATGQDGAPPTAPGSQTPPPPGGDLPAGATQPWGVSDLSGTGGTVIGPQGQEIRYGRNYVVGDSYNDDTATRPAGEDRTSRPQHAEQMDDLARQMQEQARRMEEQGRGMRAQGRAMQERGARSWPEVPMGPHTTADGDYVHGRSYTNGVEDSPSPEPGAPASIEAALHAAQRRQAQHQRAELARRRSGHDTTEES